MLQSNYDAENYRRLQQNDPDMTYYDHRYKLATWQQLVDALWQNTYVCSLILHLANAPSIDSDATPLLDYFRDTTRLRQIQIYNSNMQPLIGSILKSIALNGRIDSLSLWDGFDVKCEPFSCLMTSSSSKLKNITLDINGLNGTTTTSPSNDVFTQSIASNCNLQTVAVYVGKESDLDEFQSVLRHLGAHQTLQTLTIGYLTQYFQAPPESEDVLSIFKSLSAFLQVTKTTRYLIVSNFDVTKEGLEYLAHGLTLWSSKQYLSLNGCKLDWDALRRFLPVLQNESQCILDLGIEIHTHTAWDKVQFQFCETIPLINKAGRHISRKRSWPIQQSHRVTLLVNPTTLARAVDEIQSLKTNDGPIQFRYIGYVDKCSPMDRKVLYTRIPNLYNLKTLSLSSTPLEEFDWPFAMAVRSSASLTSVTGPVSKNSSQSLEALRTKNARGTTNTTSVLGTAKANVLVQAYCQRNMHVPTLLGQASLHQESLRQISLQQTSLQQASLRRASLRQTTLRQSSLQQSSRRRASRRQPSLQQSSHSEAHQKAVAATLLVPLLFEVIKQAPATAPNTIFRALLGM